jgi:hypothetical protein
MGCLKNGRLGRLKPDPPSPLKKGELEKRGELEFDSMAILACESERRRSVPTALS